MTVKTFDLNQHKIVVQSFKIYFSAPATAIGIFQAIESVISKYGITWESCISLVAKGLFKLLGDIFNVNGFSLDLYLHFDYDQQYSKVIKSNLVGWLVISEYLIRALKLFFLEKGISSRKIQKFKGSKMAVSRFSRLTKCFQIQCLKFIVNFCPRRRRPDKPHNRLILS